MDVRDVRRLSVSSLIVSALILGWLFVLWLQERTNQGKGGGVNWGITIDSLDALHFTGWLWAGIGVIAVVMVGLSLTSFGISRAPPGYAQGSMRQVQCQDCKAVFYVHDMGHRPLTHKCPNCKKLGVYDGKSGVVGTPPKVTAAKTVTELKLNCQSCRHKFPVTDTGVRPLNISCPSCEAKGIIR